MRVVAELSTIEVLTIAQAGLALVELSKCEYAMHGGAGDDLIGGSYICKAANVELAIVDGNGVVLTHAQLKELFEREGV
jgi:hypothetical protein